MLATGDSTMQGIDNFLADELADAAYVRSDVRPGSGITRGVYWEWHAKSQTERLRQRVTVMSVGAASDGLPIPTRSASCSLLRRAVGPEYANRARAIMQTFLREGRGRVVWMTPPEPRWGPRAADHARGQHRGRARGRGLKDVKVIRIDQMLNPSGYPTYHYRGRESGCASPTACTSTSPVPRSPPRPSPQVIRETIPPPPPVASGRERDTVAAVPLGS